MNTNNAIAAQLKKLSNRQLEAELSVSKEFAERAVFNLMHCISQRLFDVFYEDRPQLPIEYYWNDYKSHIEDIEIIKSELKRRNIP